jgi:hypothetical protein
MEPWLKVWRQGFAPQASGAGLLLLRLRLRKQEIDPLHSAVQPELLRGSTTIPEAVDGVLDWPCEAACPVGTLVIGAGAVTVEDVQNGFGRMCLEADRRVGEEAACRWFLNYYDEAPWALVREGLLAELDREIDRRFRKDEGFVER